MYIFYAILVEDLVFINPKNFGKLGFVLGFDLIHYIAFKIMFIIMF